MKTAVVLPKKLHENYRKQQKTTGIRQFLPHSPRKPRAKTHRVRDKQSRPNTGTPLDKHPDNVIPFIKHTA